MKKHPVSVGALLLAFTVALWLISRPSPKPPADTSPAAAATAATSQSPGKSLDPAPREPASVPVQPAPATGAAVLPATLPPTSKPPVIAQPDAPAVPAPESIPSLVPPAKVKIADVSADLEGVRMMIQEFRSALGENPVGNNAEIMSAVNGNNLKQARIGPPEQQQLNKEGELIDRWGTPYFFHQLSKTEMEIRSAGADRKMWSDDDIVTK